MHRRYHDSRWKLLKMKGQRWKHSLDPNLSFHVTKRLIWSRKMFFSIQWRNTSSWIASGVMFAYLTFTLILPATSFSSTGWQNPPQETKRAFKIIQRVFSLFSSSSHLKKFSVWRALAAVNSWSFLVTHRSAKSVTQAQIISRRSIFLLPKLREAKKKFSSRRNPSKIIKNRLSQLNPSYLFKLCIPTMPNCSADFYLIKRFNTLRSTTSSSLLGFWSIKTISYPLIPKTLLIEYTTKLNYFYIFPLALQFQQQNNSTLNPKKRFPFARKTQKKGRKL